MNLLNSLTPTILVATIGYNGSLFGVQMKSFNMRDAKNTLSKIVEHVESEKEEVFIARRGIPCARIAPVKKMVHRPKGLLKGKIKIKQDLDTL